MTDGTKQKNDPATTPHNSKKNGTAHKGGNRKLEVESDELRVTSENAREVGESLAKARLCRGEACLARRIDTGDRYNASPAITDNDV